ncbi:MFS transporter macrolide efflux protein [Candidatus Termititenax persephonae]|uniref:MFS transporter macrolide efflux protein n=1 Tax=Candidatus Termititenax persephonae TaxID=2218525 RepID=A0A388TL52_9BACT|nr:MFS transporter macrolide efflux protein [Candidatus Termititenax persephonae]
MKNWKKNAALFLSGQALSIFGSLVVQHAIGWHIVLKSQSGSLMTLYVLAAFLPMFLISPFGGIWADRFNRKHLINLADGSIALTSLVVAVLLIFGFDHYGILLFCSGVRALGQGIQMPAVGAFIPQIVPAQQLTRVNGLQSAIQSFSTLTAPLLAGALLSIAPLEILFFLDVSTAALSIGILCFGVKTPRQSQVKTPVQHSAFGYFSDLKAGWQYIGKHAFVFELIVLSAIFTFCLAPASFLTPLQTARNFGSEVWRLSVIEITFSAGMLLGGIFISVWGGFKRKTATMALSCAVFGGLTIGLGLAGNFPLYVAFMTVLGLVVPLYNTPVMVLLQTNVEAAYMGRVMSVFLMLGSALMPMSMLIFGPLADTIKIDFLLIGTGLVMALLAIPYLASKKLRAAG